MNVELNLKNKIDPEEAKSVFLQALFAFDNLTIHKRGDKWTVKIRKGDKWIVRESTNLFVSTFLCAKAVIS